MSKKVRAKLEEALRSQRPVEIERNELNQAADNISGFVVSIGPDWVVVAVLDEGVYFDGWQALRVRDVSQVREQTSAFARYLSRALATLGPIPEVPASILDAANHAGHEALDRLIPRSGLVGLYMEKRWPDELYIGVALGVFENSHYMLREIGVAGDWNASDSHFKAKRISRIVCGGRYLDALEQFGEPIPLLGDAPAES